MASGFRFPVSVLLAAWALVGVAGCGGGPGGYEYIPPDVPRERDGLQLVTSDSDFQREYLKPGLDLSQYDGILLVPVELVYNARYKRNHRFERDNGPDQTVPGKELDQQHAADLAQMRKMFRKALLKQLSESSAYRLVEEPGAGVLSLSVGVVNLDLELVDAGEDSTGQVTYGLPASVELVASLRDGANGELLAEMVQVSQSHQDGFESSDGVMFWGEIRDAFDSWAKDFRGMLEHSRRAHGGPAN